MWIKSNENACIINMDYIKNIHIDLNTPSIIFNLVEDYEPEDMKYDYVENYNTKEEAWSRYEELQDLLLQKNKNREIFKWMQSAL